MLVWNWAFAPVDSQDPTEVHYVELELRDGEFVVVGTNDYTVSAGEPTGVGDNTEPSCVRGLGPLDCSLAGQAEDELVQ